LRGVLVFVASVGTFGPRPMQAQYVDCNYFCWTLPCYFYCAAAIRSIYPVPLRTPQPTDEMWETPETVVLLN